MRDLKHVKQYIIELKKEMTGISSCDKVISILKIHSCLYSISDKTGDSFDIDISSYLKIDKKYIESIRIARNDIIHLKLSISNSFDETNKIYKKLLNKRVKIYVTCLNKLIEELNKENRCINCKVDWN